VRIQTDLWHFLLYNGSITRQHTHLHEFLRKIDDPGTRLYEWPDDI
jgi:hypothetical protein